MPKQMRTPYLDPKSLKDSWYFEYQNRKFGPYASEIAAWDDFERNVKGKHCDTCEDD